MKEYQIERIADKLMNVLDSQLAAGKLTPADYKSLVDEINGLVNRLFAKNKTTKRGGRQMDIKDVVTEAVSAVVFFAAVGGVVALIFMYGW